MTDRNPLSAWPAFAAAVEQRLEKGAVTFGNRSFTLPPGELAGEVEQELLDLCASSFILWCRVRTLRERVLFRSLQYRRRSRPDRCGRPVAHALAATATGARGAAERS